jgi:subfamily B ATP-binding cassette protein MsbA
VISGTPTLPFGLPVPANSAIVFYGLLSACLILGGLKAFANYGAYVSLKRNMLLASNELRRRMFERTLSFGKLYFDRNPPAKLQHTLQKASRGIADQLEAFHTIFSHCFLFLAYAFVMFSISVPLTFAIALLLMALGPWARRGVDRIKANALQLTTAEESLSHHISEVLSCLPLIRSTCEMGHEKNRFARLSAKETRLSVESSRQVEMIRPIEYFIQLAALVSIAIAIHFLGGTPLGNLFVFLYLVMASLHSFNAILRGQFRFARVKGEMRALDHFFDDSDKVFVPEGSRVYRGLEKEIEFRDLRFSYVPGVPVLNGVSFKIEKGSTVGMIGPTGGGKSTLLNLLMRFYDCPALSIWIDSDDIRTISTESWVARVAYVGQEPPFFNDSIWENLVYGAPREIARQEAQEALEKMELRLDLDTLIGTRGSRLSGGERQRLALARAYLRRSEFLILDDATSALDPDTERRVREVMIKVVPRQTTLVVSHRHASLSYVDKIIELDHGRVIREG